MSPSGLLLHVSLHVPLSGSNPPNWKKEINSETSRDLHPFLSFFNLISILLLLLPSLSLSRALIHTSSNPTSIFIFIPNSLFQVTIFLLLHLHGTCEEPEKTPECRGRGELKPPRVLEALSASGLRALRYAREIEGIGQVVALDNDKEAVEACRRNIKFNGSVASEKVESNLADARVFMLTHPKEFEVVDLDPYGSPSVFLDSAVQSIADGGLLMCTATDMVVLCGGNGEVCYSKYGSYPLRGKYCHEMALRVLLACIESHANRYKRYIVPVLSVQMDFYVRVFVRIYISASAMKNTPLKISYVYQCIGCDSFHLQPLARTVSKVTCMGTLCLSYEG